MYYSGTDCLPGHDEMVVAAAAAIVSLLTYIANLIQIIELTDLLTARLTACLTVGLMLL